MSGAEDLARLARLAHAHKHDIEAGGEDGAADWIYRNWYINPPAAASTPALPYAHLGSALTAIAQRAVPWEAEWVVLSAAGDGSIVIGRGTIYRRELAGAYASVARPGLQPAPGEQVLVPAFLSWTDLATAQWAAQSPKAPEGPMVRVYVNVGPSDVGVAVDALLKLVSRSGASFSMKCPGPALAFARADSLVFYVEAEVWPDLQGAALEAIAASGAALRQAIPALTRKLGSGIGFAEDPGGGQSFGRSRCTILGSALLSSTANSADELERALVHALEAAGIDPARPWANPS